ncbi:hypothetical protein [Paenibacillus sp. YN15]|uniref:hypothetical protein n=1 Tax=Paenibacillus sp. YN15 TaxID=1742774 RepID=UPI000DCB0DA3|nr:hypothetical protein [Paenibacillus sp. YN15]RAV01753.1 hypothetical protein DQG13_11625 [Paenibacillus sp. YN15]
MVRNFALIVIMIVGVFALVACDSASEQPGASMTAPGAGNGSPTVAASAAAGAGAGDPSPTPSPNAPDTAAAGLIKRIAFTEENETTNRMLVSWETAELPEGPLKVVYHWEKLFIVLEFAEADAKSMSAVLDGIELGGKKAEIIPMAHDEKQIQVKLLLPVGTSAPLSLGGLPDIIIERRETLGYVPAETAGKGDSDALLLRAREYGVHLLLPAERDSVALQFSEDMLPALPVDRDGRPVQAEWEDMRKLRIALGEAGSAQEPYTESYFRLDTLEAVSGNRLYYEEGSLVIRRMPSSVWKDSLSGEALPMGPRDRLYDQLIISPDKRSYVGVVSIGGPMGDGDGWSYAFILEREGKEPAVLEHVFYSTVEPGDAPISWTGSDSLMYTSYAGVFTYDINSLTKTILRSHQRDESDNIHFAVWDPFRKLSYVLAFQNRMESGMVSFFTYGGGELLKTEEDFSRSALINKYHLLDLSVLPVADGIYRTKTREGLPYTEYIGTDGSRYTADGIARLAADGGVYLQLYKDGGQNIIPAGWRFWRPGEKERAMAEPPGQGQGHFFVSGSELILSLEEAFYRYDAKLDAWPLWSPPNGEKGAEPVRGPDGLYKVRESEG